MKDACPGHPPHAQTARPEVKLLKHPLKSWSSSEAFSSGSGIKCKVPFGKARGPAQAPNRRTSHITREIWPGGTLQRVG